jgi:cytochrome c5
MSNDAHTNSDVSLIQKVIIILGGIIAPLFVIYVVTKSPETAKPKALDRADIVDNIKPLAQVELAKVDDGPAVIKTGEEIVNQACAACHAAGVMGSPKLGDAGAWTDRIAQGYETLTKHAIEGIRTMPAKGGNPDLTDNDIAKAVAYMANQAGANFTPPAE